jgi:dUTP pyrophosphatase
MTSLFVKRLNCNAKLPFKKHIYDAGYDLYSTDDCVIEPLDQKLIGTGISINIPHGYYGRIAPRSGFSYKNFTDIGAGVIDENYTGELKILVRNYNKNKSIHIKLHDRIAQLILEKIGYFDIVEVDELNISERGSNGFGSTDKL